MEINKVFNLRDDLAAWILERLSEDWRTNGSSGDGDEFERGVFDLVERMMVEWKVGYIDE